MWPRSDLHSWVQVLNKFDDILRGFIEQYELEKLQVNPFTPLTKAIITEILRYETLLLDNSTNRKLFASYDVRFQTLGRIFAHCTYFQMCSASTHFFSPLTQTSLLALCSFCSGHLNNTLLNHRLPTLFMYPQSV